VASGANGSAGAVVALHTAPESGAPVDARERIEVLPGQGVRGDRHFSAEPTAARGTDLTLIEREAIAAVERDYGIELPEGAHRRNVTTDGVALNHLVGERFRVGEVVCEGVVLCEPCSHLADLTDEPVDEAFAHRGGLRVDVVEGGTVAVGAAVGRE